MAEKKREGSFGLFSVSTFTILGTFAFLAACHQKKVRKKDSRIEDEKKISQIPFFPSLVFD